MNLTRLEKETLISFNEAESECHIQAHNAKLINRLDKFCKEFPESFRLDRIGDDGDKYYTINKKYVKIGKPSTRPDLVGENNFNRRKSSV